MWYSVIFTGGQCIAEQLQAINPALVNSWTEECCNFKKRVQVVMWSSALKLHWFSNGQLCLIAPSSGRHGKGGTFPRQFQLPNRSKDYGDRKKLNNNNTTIVSQSKQLLLYVLDDTDSFTQHFQTFSSTFSSRICHFSTWNIFKYFQLLLHFCFFCSLGKFSTWSAGLLFQAAASNCLLRG